MTRPAPINAMRFSLRTLLIVLVVVPPLIGATWAVRYNLPDAAAAVVMIAVAPVIVAVNAMVLFAVGAAILEAWRDESR